MNTYYILCISQKVEEKGYLGKSTILIENQYFPLLKYFDFSDQATISLVLGDGVPTPSPPLAPSCPPSKSICPIVVPSIEMNHITLGKELQIEGSVSSPEWEGIIFTR